MDLGLLADIISVCNAEKTFVSETFWNFLEYLTKELACECVKSTSVSIIVAVICYLAIPQ